MAKVTDQTVKVSIASEEHKTNVSNGEPSKAARVMSSDCDVESIHSADYKDDGDIEPEQTGPDIEPAPTGIVLYHRITMQVLHFAALQEPEDLEEPTTKEKCVDCCCQAFTCNFSKISQSITKTRVAPVGGESDPAFEMINYMTPVLRRGRSKGWLLLAKLIPSAVKESYRNVWVASELAILLLALVFSITSVSLSQNEIFNVLHLVLTIIGTLLAVIDGVILLYECGLFKKCRAACQHGLEKVEDNNLSDNTGSNDDLGSHSESNCCSKDCCCSKDFFKTSRSVLDFIRMALSELIFYPLVICSIFEVVTSQAYRFNSAADGVNFVLLIITLTLLLFFVYLVRIVLLIFTNYLLQKARKLPKVEEESKQVKQHQYNSSIRNSALLFEIYFIYHVIAQMVIQVLMIIAIGAKIRDDNSHLFENAVNTEQPSTIIDSGTTATTTIPTTTSTDIKINESIHVSVTLWYMLIGGYIFPAFGVITFFLANYFWLQEYPIGFCIDCLSVMNITKRNESGSIVDQINRYIHFMELKNEFKLLRQNTCCDKFIYPFKSPQMVIICIAYTLLQLGFVVCAGVSSVGPLGGGGWLFFYIVAIVMGFIANLHVFTIAIFWNTIIITVIVLIAIVIAVIAAAIAIIIGFIWLIFILGIVALICSFSDD